MLAAALQGLDAFVFTAGIGENSASHPRAHRRTARLARRRARSGRERPPRAADLALRQPDPRLCRADRRRTDDRAAHAVAADEAVNRQRQTGEGVMNIPVFPETKVALKGKQGPDRRHRQRSVDRLGLRQGVPRARRRSRRHLSEREGQEARRAAGAGAGSADLHAARRHGRRADGAGVRAHREGMGPARFPAALDRVLAEGGACTAAWSTSTATAS